jgi:hypothetical protein
LYLVLPFSHRISCIFSACEDALEDALEEGLSKEHDSARSTTGKERRFYLEACYVKCFVFGGSNLLKIKKKGDSL